MSGNNDLFYEQLIEKLQQNAEKDFAGFQRKITPNAGEVLGVRMGTLRDIAKKLDYYALKACFDKNCFEQRLLLGLSLAYAKKLTPQEFFAEVDYVSHVFETWAEVDCFCSTVKKYDGLFEYAVSLTGDNAEFVARTGIVLIKRHFLDDEHIDRALDVISGIKTQYYYVRMGAAWTLCDAFIKHPDETRKVLFNRLPDDETVLMAIGKCIDSYRVLKESKDELRELRKRIRTKL